MKPIECIEYNISLFEDLTFMQRNCIRYVIKQLIQHNYEIIIKHIENFVPIYIDNKLSHYKLTYLYMKDCNDTLTRTSIEVPLSIGIIDLLKTSFFFTCMKFRDKYNGDRNIIIHEDIEVSEYFINYKNYP